MATNSAPYRALSLKQPSNLRKAIRDAQRDSTALIGTAIGIPSVETTRMVATMPADWAWIDAEHTPFGQKDMAAIIQTVNVVSEGRMFPVVRVPNHEHDWIAYALDAGAAGIIVPHTETVEQVRHTIEAVKFGPVGKRSFPPFALVPMTEDMAPPGQTFIDVANDHVAIIPQIESALGVENMEEIIQIPEVDLVFIGMGDLRLDLGLSLGQTGTEPSFLAATDRIFSLAKKYNKPLGGFVFEPALAERYKQGYRLLAPVSDFHALSYGMLQGLASGKAIAAQARKELVGDELSNTEDAVSK